MRKLLVVICFAFWAAISVAQAADMMRIHVHFDSIHKLQEKDSVVLGTRKIGHVERLAYVQEGYFKVTLAINEEPAAGISENTRFIIADDPAAPYKKSVQVIQIRIGGEPLKDGATVAGSDKYAVWVEDMKGDLKDGVDFLKDGMNELSKDLENLPENERVKALQAEIERLAEVMRTATKETRDKIEKEILPFLEQEMERLREQLKNYGREEEMTPLDDEIERIRRI